MSDKQVVNNVDTEAGVLVRDLTGCGEYTEAINVVTDVANNPAIYAGMGYEKVRELLYTRFNIIVSQRKVRELLSLTQVDVFKFHHKPKIVAAVEPAEDAVLVDATDVDKRLTAAFVQGAVQATAAVLAGLREAGVPITPNARNLIQQEFDLSIF